MLEFELSENCLSGDWLSYYFCEKQTYLKIGLFGKWPSLSDFNNPLERGEGEDFGNTNTNWHQKKKSTKFQCAN